LKFIGSQDLEETLKTNPLYQNFLEKNSELAPIISIIVSTAALTAGVVLVVATWGTATPLVSFGCGLLISTSALGLQRGIQGIIEQKFDFPKLLTDIAVNVGVSLITFGAGYVTGCAGIYLSGAKTIEELTNISRYSVLIAGAASGAATGSTVCYVKSKLGNGEIDIFEIIFEGIVGAMNGLEGANYAIIQLKAVKVSKFKQLDSDDAKNILKEQISILENDAISKGSQFIEEQTSCYYTVEYLKSKLPWDIFKSEIFGQLQSSEWKNVISKIVQELKDGSILVIHFNPDHYLMMNVTDSVCSILQSWQNTYTLADWLKSSGKSFKLEIFGDYLTKLCSGSPSEVMEVSSKLFGKELTKNITIDSFEKITKIGGEFGHPVELLFNFGQ
jgi:hypothetical protein